MPLYAGVYETNITPPPDMWMGGYAGRGQAVGVHDELYARALVLDAGKKRIALVVADLVALPEDAAQSIREDIAAALDADPAAVMLHCTHTHGGPYVFPYRGMGEEDEAYNSILIRKLRGLVLQAAENMQPAHLTYGETSAQIGINRRQTGADGTVRIGTNYGGPVSPLVQTLCVNGADGRTFALLFSHACHPTTLGGDNRLLTADWPGAAVAHLKERFAKESVDTGIAADALPIFLQGCCGDINPLRRGNWEASQANGRSIADAAHTARWNAHGRLDEELDFAEVTVSLPLLPPPSSEECQKMATEADEKAELARGDGNYTLYLHWAGQAAWARDNLKIADSVDYRFEQPFTIQKLSLGGVTLLGFPAEMFVEYQQAIARMSSSPVFCLGYTNGCRGYLATDAEHARGGYEIDEAYKYYGTLNFAPGCEAVVLQAVRELLDTPEPEMQL